MRIRKKERVTIRSSVGMAPRRRLAANLSM
jgi:hypothetical protein